MKADDRQRSVLVVDDNVDFLSEIKLLLASNDIRDVLALSNSSEVIPLLEMGGVSVVLMDWMMPE
ncbi:MAG TPA: response regulator, partial [Deltaproteobacteria bacterium]|nr:response regulator [Deltaproteobacteria bacterium]